MPRLYDYLTDDEFFDAILDRMDSLGMLLQGARYRLRAVVEPNYSDPAGTIGRLMKVLDGDDGKRYWSPSYKPPKDSHPVREMLRRFPINPDMIDKLAEMWYLDLNGLEPRDMASSIFFRLDRHPEYLESKWHPAVPRSEIRLRKTLSLFESQLKPGFTEELVSRYHAEFGTMPQHQVNLVMARILGSDANGTRYLLGDKLEWSPLDEMFHPPARSPEEEAAIKEVAAERGNAPSGLPHL
ncbi:MAG: hypothetical protein ABI353_16925 [Isosphaeraceae bacterium]